MMNKNDTQENTKRTASENLSKPLPNEFLLKKSQRPVSMSFCENRSDTMESNLSARRRMSTRDFEIKELNSKPISLATSCDNHTNKQYEYFCVDHTVLCCKECISGIHKLCLNFMPLETAAIGAKCSQEFKYTQKKLADTEMRLISLDEREKSHSEGNNVSRSDFSQSVLEKFGKHPSSHTSHHKREIENIALFLWKVRKQRELYDLIERNGSDIQAFLITHLSKTIINQIEKQVLAKDQKHNKLSLKRLSLKRIKSTDSGLSIGGTVWHPEDNVSSPNIDKTLTYPPIDVRRNASKTNRVRLTTEKTPEHSLRFMYNIDLNNVGHVSIYGMTMTDDDMLLLCDSSRPRILVCDKMDKYQNQINTRYDPWDIAVFPDTQYAVTSSTHDDHAIQFIDIGKRTFSKDIKLKHSGQGGITIANRNIFVCAEHKLHMLDHKGHKLRKLSGLPSKSHYLNTHQTDKIVLFSEQDLLSISQDGCVHFTLTSPDIVSPGKPAADSAGNVYFPDLLSHNIYKVSTMNNSICTMLTANDGIHFPTALVMDRKCSKIYVANNAGNSVGVFAIDGK